MKTTRLLAVAAVLTALSACNKEEGVKRSGNFPSDGLIHVVTSVDGMHSRTSMTADDLSAFYMKVVNANDSKYSYYAEMNRENGIWSSYKAGSSVAPVELLMLWRNKTDVISVTAIAKRGLSISENDFDNSQSAYYVSTGQSDHEAYLQSDILYAPAKIIDPSKDLTDDGKIKVVFGHLLSKLNLKITLGTEFNSVPGTMTNPLADVNVNGTFVGLRFRASTGERTGLTGGVMPIAPWHDAAKMYTAGNGAVTNAIAGYEVVMVPQDVMPGRLTVSFTLNGKDYTWRSADGVKLESGYQYNLDLTVGKAIVTMDGITASEWINGTGGSLETE